jgi:hypothetical protein
MKIVRSFTNINYKQASLHLYACVQFVVQHRAGEMDDPQDVITAALTHINLLTKKLHP